MADNESRVEGSFESDSGGMVVENGEVTREGGSVEVYALRPKVETVEDDSDTVVEEGTKDAPEDTSKKEEAPEEDDSEPIELEDLAEFDAASEEIVKAYNSTYKDEGGNLLIDRFGLELDRNIQRDGKAELNPGTYSYLETLGIPRSLVDGQIAMRENSAAWQKVQAEKDDLALFDLAGGPEALNAAKEWATKGGYTEAQQKRHEDALKSTDKAVREEAVELLMTRYSKANPPKEENEEERIEPKRDATKNGSKPSGVSVKPFANRQEWREARAAAGDNLAALREVDRRARVSKF